jgi:rod shape-determining protein MreC
MPLGTLDRSPPPFFKQGPSALTKLMVFGALGLLLMVADVRWHLTQPLRSALSVVLYPVQWLAMRPVVWGGLLGESVQLRDAAQLEATRMRERLLAQTVRASQVEQLALENQRLRGLLNLRDRVPVSSQAAEVLYEAADPYSRKLIVNKGLTQGVQLSSPVMDEQGVLGQVTRVYPLLSEVTLLTDREQAISVLNTRTGVRGVAYGEYLGAPQLELRYLATNADIEVGDVLTTSGIDGVYPPGLQVAKVVKVERRAGSMFARVLAEPLSQAQGVRHVLLLEPVGADMPARPELERARPVERKGARR